MIVVALAIVVVVVVVCGIGGCNVSFLTFMIIFFVAPFVALIFAAYLLFSLP